MVVVTMVLRRGKGPAGAWRPAVAASAPGPRPERSVVAAPPRAGGYGVAGSPASASTTHTWPGANVMRRPPAVVKVVGSWSRGRDQVAS